jgi:hypothetical protein
VPVRKKQPASGVTEVFLSHSSKDLVFTKKLAAVLRDHGVPVWYSERDIKGAQQWHDEIGAALERCDWMVLILTPNANASKWVKRELLFALDEERYRDRLVPIVAKACSLKELSWVISQMQMIKFDRRFREGCRELLKVWGLGLKPS